MRRSSKGRGKISSKQNQQHISIDKKVVYAIVFLSQEYYAWHHVQHVAQVLGVKISTMIIQK